MSDFVQLHLHSKYSVLDGIPELDQYAKKAKEYGHTHLAITDHGKANGFFDLHQACKTSGIHPIFGIEMYINNNLVAEEVKAGKEKRVRTKDAHLILLAKNKIGYDNLLKLNYISNSDDNHYYYNPRITLEELFQHSEGIIVGSACIASPFGGILRGEDPNKIQSAFSLAKTFKEVFKDDFYFEVQLNEITGAIGTLANGQKTYNKILIGLANKLDVPVVITGDVHYLERGQDNLQTLSIAVRNKDTIDNLTFELESKNLYYHNVEDYLRFNREFGYNYKEEDIIGWCKNSTRIAEKVEFEFPKRTKMFLPEITSNDASSLVENAKIGLAKKLSVDRFEDAPKEYKDRLERELEVIDRKGFSSYFLIYEDIYKFAKDNKIMRGSGRGCFLPGNNVRMANGKLKPIEKIKEGDTVLNIMGIPTDVEKLYRFDIAEDIVCLNCDDGTIIKCTKDHAILIKTEDNTPIWMPAENIDDTMKIAKIPTASSKDLYTKCYFKTFEFYAGSVYDIKVSMADSYNIENKIVHNSGAGSLVLYALDATTIDPIKYDLLFERFLSESRCSDMAYAFFKE